ncbi:carboxypeptidase regulatory-like domain-containing protein [bacterium AH-315-O15]|nr:carboxypeptidase regulatory-like domain-containing protein [bacterium AH-315-O15]
MRRHAYRPVASALVTVGMVAALLAWPQAQEGNRVAIDADDIGGVVTGPNGPEAGVWVIAETTDLPTRYTEIVVTDDEGRYVLPDLPEATYKMWVRGYGLVDSVPVQGTPGQPQNLTATVAPSTLAASQYYPANYWLALLQFPPASEFPGTGPQGNGIPTSFESQDAWVSSVKCANCHQIGNKVTRELRAVMANSLHSSEAVWDRRVKSGQSGVPMSNAFSRPGRARNMKLWADWTDRIAAGEHPQVAPPRPRGVERNVVLKMWDWGGREPYQLVHDEVVTDRRNPTVNANGRVWGTGDGRGNLVWLDPMTHTTGEVSLPTLDEDPDWASNFGPQEILAPSPVWNERLTWDPRAPHTPMLDQQGRVWMATKLRDPEDQPEFCKAGSTNKFAAYFPLDRSGYQAAMYDPKTKDMSMIDTCFGGSHLMFGEDKDNTLFYSSSNQFAWINTRIFDETKDGQAAQGWVPAVLDTNGDGKISRGWTEPNQPIDPTRDHRVEFGCYHVVTNPVDDSIWCPPSRFPGTITRMDLGSNPPETARAEQYEVPPGTGFNPRGMDFDRDGVAWISFAGSGHMASFDRRKCTVLNGPTATGQHCVEGWTFYDGPGPKMGGSRAGADYFYMAWVDQHDTLGLGRDIPMTQGSNSDSLLALMPETGEWVTLRVPYPMGMFARSHDGRIDDPNGGWKGRAVWTTNATAAIWHTEGGIGQKSKVVKIQMRPNPLAK